MFEYKNYDVAVIGAGHAGIEAALAAARMGCSTAIFTITLDAIGNMVPQCLWRRLAGQCWCTY